MASQLTFAHIEAERRLRVTMATAVERVWKSLPHYNEENVDEWLTKVVPLVDTGKRQSIALTEAYLARATSSPIVGVNNDEIMAALRNGAKTEDVYRRPFVTVWTALANGIRWQDAVNAGELRAVDAAETDMQLAMRETLRAYAMAS